MDADVAIIGTGPAGGMAACRLAASGLRTVILEKSTLPRPKPCGGAMPSRVTQVIDWNFDELIERRISSVKNQFDHSQEQLARTSAPILMVSRPQFDQHLIERALRLSGGDVQLRERFRAHQVREDEAGVSVRGEDGTEVRARYLIAGDGAYSKTARCLGLNRQTNTAVAMDAKVEVAAEVYETEKERATFNYFCLPKGYGWIFPKAGHLSCGVGAWGGNTKVRHALDDFLNRSFPAGSIRAVRVSSHTIPLYSGQRHIATRRVCLVGDAASLVDPILGEGIRFALISGGVAADVIMRLCGSASPARSSDTSMSPSDGDCRRYQTAITGLLGGPLGTLSQFISPIFIQAPEFFYRKFVLQGGNYSGLSTQLAIQVNAYTS